MTHSFPTRRSSDLVKPKGETSTEEKPRVRSRGVNSSDVPLKKWTPYTSHSKNESIQSFSGSTQADGYWATQSSRPTANWPSTISPEESSVGKECVSTRRSRWWTYL